MDKRISEREAQPPSMSYNQNRMYLWRTFAGRHLIFAAVKGHDRNSIAVAVTFWSRLFPGDRCVRPSPGHGSCRARRGRGCQPGLELAQVGPLMQEGPDVQ